MRKLPKLQRWICCQSQMLVNVSIIYLREYIIFGSLVFECFHHIWKYQVSYLFPTHALVSLVLSKFLMGQGTCQLRLHLVGWRFFSFPHFSTFRKTFFVSIPFYKISSGSLTLSLKQWCEWHQCVWQSFTTSIGKNGEGGVLEMVYKIVLLLFLN